MPKVRWVLSYGFAANFMRFPAVHKNFESRLRFDKVTDMQFNGGNFFLRHIVVRSLTVMTKHFVSSQGDVHLSTYK